MEQSIRRFLPFHKSNSPYNLSQTQIALGRQCVTGPNQLEVRGITIALLFLALIGSTLVPDTLWAATINAASCSSSDVQSASNSASNGDTVIVPSCSSGVTWTSQVIISKSITLQGQTIGCPSACVDNTVIIDGLTKGNGTLDAVFLITTVAGFPARITGFTFQGGSGGQGFSGSIQIGGLSKQLRIDHNHFLNLHDLNLNISGWQYGVADHNRFDMGVCIGLTNWCSTPNNGIAISHEAWGNGVFGDQSWADPSNLGSGNAFFVEDNIFNNGAVNDVRPGGRMVVRNNTITNGMIQNHNGASRGRNGRTLEVYNNTLFWTPVSQGGAFSQALFLRAGTGVVWGNTTTGYVVMVNSFNDRSSRCEPIFQGSGIGAANPCGPTTFPNGNPWDQSGGYATLDQMGRGQGDLLTPDPMNPVNAVTGTVAWPHQTLEPWYEWNNTYKPPVGYGGATKWTVDPASIGVIQENRDYYLNTAMPGYTPYTYPHPLVTSSGDTTPPAAPQNLTVK